MRSSSVVFFGVLGLVALSACSVSTTDNSITFKTKPEYVDKSQPAKSSSEWTGQAIVVNNDGVNPLVGDGGVEIIADPSATTVTAKAIFAGRADTEAEAQESIRDALGTFAITESGGTITVTCKHGNDHGSSAGGQSGCKLLTVTVPAGTTDLPVKLTVGDGNGGIRFGSTPLVVSSLIVDENGSGDVSVKVNPVAGASVVVTGEDAVTVAVPSTFSAESVVLTVEASDGEEAAARIITTAFPGMKSNQPYPISGATADAAKTLNVQSKGILDVDTVTIASF